MMGLKFIPCVVSLCSRNCSTTTTKWGRKSWGKLEKMKNCTKIRKERIKWTDEQKEILEKAKCGHSMFITGSAGTGKTILLKEIIKSVKKPHRVFVTASTGVAACALKGQTLHSFAGIGNATADRKKLLERVLEDMKAVKRWTAANVLVIDEISMVDPILFDSLDYIARNVRECDEPWGGLQLIVCGDFLQLPPVVKWKSSSDKEFAFEADCWDSCFDMQVELTKVFRQSDSRLIKLLQGIRRGETDAEDLKYLEQSCSITEPDPWVVRLFPRIKDVEKVNNDRLKELCNDIVVYEAEDSGIDPWRSRLKHSPAPERVELCKEARVMLIKNLNPRRKLVNGAAGVITGFVKPVTDMGFPFLPVVKFDCGVEMTIEPERWDAMEGNRIIASRWQIPVILAWALSIHKCQGMTLDKLHTDLSRAFGCGMVYVALSRVQSLEGLHLSGFSPKKIKAHPKVLEFYRGFGSKLDCKGEDKAAEKKIENSGLEIPHKTSDGGSKYNFCLKDSILAWQRSNGKVCQGSVVCYD